MLARAGNPPATHLNCKWPERFSVPPSDRMKLFRETPLELGSSSLPSLRVSVCVRASLLSALPSHLVIRRSPRKRSSYLRKVFLTGRSFSFRDFKETRGVTWPFVARALAGYNFPGNYIA